MYVGLEHISPPQIKELVFKLILDHIIESN
jgi:hypothetical protein